MVAAASSPWRGKPSALGDPAPGPDCTAPSLVTDFAGLDADGIPIRVDGPRLQVRADHVPVDDEVWPERIPAARLIELAARRMSAGRDFEEDRALYLRAPDVQPPKPGLLSGVRGR